MSTIVYSCHLKDTGRLGVELWIQHTARLAYDFLTTVDRDIIPQLMNFSTFLKDFRIEYDSIIKLADQEEPELPKISKDLPIMS